MSSMFASPVFIAPYREDNHELIQINTEAKQGKKVEKNWGQYIYKHYKDWKQYFSLNQNLAC